MVDLDVSVLVAEENATRADLYDHWLVGFDVRKALTTRQAVEAFDTDVAVVILDEEFGEGKAPDLIDWIDASAGFCQVATTTTDRGRVFPDQDVAEHLVKPVFKDDLRSLVKRLARQTVYASFLAEYYSATVRLAGERDDDVSPAEAAEEAEGAAGGADDAENADDAGDSADATEDSGKSDHVVDLEERVEQLKAVILQLRQTLDEDDMHRVAELVTPTPEPAPADSGRSSKYMPDKCSKCGRPWGGDESTGVLRLGAGVYRCADCGNVQFVAAAGNPRLRRSK